MNQTRRSFSILFAVSVLISAANCSRSKPAGEDTPPHTPVTEADTPPALPVAVASPSVAALGACRLLSDEEIERVQGVAVKDRKPSQNSVNGLTVSQCYFTLPDAADSVVLTVHQRAERDPKEVWEQMFDSSAKRKEEEQEKEHRAAGFEKIVGLGDEAVWMAQRFGGTLLVLKGDCFIRLSVGGGVSSDQSAKSRNMQALAELVLARL